MKKPILLDGAVGTSLWAKAEEHGYSKDAVWTYNMTHPEIVGELAKEYADAGSQCILTNTFGANRYTCKKSSYSVKEVITAGVQITKKALIGTLAKTTLAVGPLPVLLEPYGDLTEEECREIYEEIISTGVDAGVDAILLQTFFDLEMMRIATEVAVSFKIPVFCTMTFEKVGKTMMGNSVEDVISTLEPLGITGIGMNCSLGPDLAIPIIKEFREKTALPLVFKPNAGLPIGAQSSDPPMTAKDFALAVKPAMEFVQYIGGCCGSDPSFIRKLQKQLEEI